MSFSDSTIIQTKRKFNKWMDLNLKRKHLFIDGDDCKIAWTTAWTTLVPIFSIMWDFRERIGRLLSMSASGWVASEVVVDDKADIRRAVAEVQEAMEVSSNFAKLLLFYLEDWSIFPRSESNKLGWMCKKPIFALTFSISLLHFNFRIKVIKIIAGHAHCDGRFGREEQGTARAG